MTGPQGKSAAKHGHGMPWRTHHNITVVRYAHLSSAFGASPSAASSRFVVSSSRSDIAPFARATEARPRVYFTGKKIACWIVIARGCGEGRGEERRKVTLAGASFTMVATDITLWSDDRTFQENVDQLLVGIPAFGFLLAQYEFARRGRH